MGLNFLAGKEVEWADQKFLYEGTPCAAIQGCKFGVKTDKAHLFAEGDENIGIQSGNRQPTGSVKLLKSAVDALNIAAKSAGGRDLTDLVGNIVFTYKQQGVRALQTLTLIGVEFSQYEYGMEQNAKSMAIDLPFLYTDIVFG